MTTRFPPPLRTTNTLYRHETTPSAGWSRRQWLHALVSGVSATATASLLGGCSPVPGPAEGPGALRTALAWIRNVEYAGLWMALANGFYEEEGVTPLFLNGGPNAPMPAVAVAARDAHIGFDNDLRHFMDAIARGNDLVLLGAQYQRSPAAVLSLASRPVRKPEDLLGIRFLGQEGTQTNVEAVLTIAGLPLEYTFIPAGYAVDPLIEGQGEAYACFAVNQPITLQMRYGMQEGRDYVVTPWSDLGLPGYANMLFAPRHVVQENFESLVGFLRATIRGWQLANADPAHAARLVVDTYGADLGLDFRQQARQCELQVPFMGSPLTDRKGLFWVDSNILGEEMYPALKAAGRVDLPDPTAVIDTSVLEAAYAAGSRDGLMEARTS